MRSRSEVCKSDARWSSFEVDGSDRPRSVYKGLMGQQAPTLFDRWSRTYDDEGLQRSTYRALHDAVIREVER